MSNDTPKVIGAPHVIFLNYGDIPDDTQHSEFGEVSWCEMAHDASDVKYVRADIAQALLHALKDCTKELNYPEIDPLVWPTLHKAYAAIAKAEGVLND